MKTLRATEVFRSTSTRVVAVESIERQHNRMPFGVQLASKLAPVAIVVKDESGVSAFDLENVPLEIDDLIESVPGLDYLVHDENKR